MVVVRQGMINFPVFQTELNTGGDVFSFHFKKREDLTIKVFDSTPDDQPSRASIFTWTIVQDPGSDNPSLDTYYFSIGQWDYKVYDSNGVLLDSGLFRVDALQRAEPTEYNLEQTFKVYGQE